jgi:hypothetical protein
VIFTTLLYYLLIVALGGIKWLFAKGHVEQAISVDLSIPGIHSFSSLVGGIRLVASSGELEKCTGSTTFLEFTVPGSRSANSCQ